MKVIIAVGGGGHFSPALSVIQALPPEMQVLLVGRQYAFEGDKTLSYEYRTAQELGIPFTAITTGRLQRKFSKHTLGSLAKIPSGLVEAVQVVRSFKPDVVLSFGGYVALPVTLAAKLLGIPVVIHEQTLGAGLANKISGTFATKICISWETSQKYFPKDRTVLTGNPIRPAIKHALRQWKDTQVTPPLLYVTGGSGGSHAINVMIEHTLSELLKHFTLLHQTGDAKTYQDFERLEKLRTHLPETLRERYILKKFLTPDEAGKALVTSFLVISRSGINTVTELLYIEKPCILIPLPHGQNNEQRTNALFVQKQGLAEVLEQQTATPDRLMEVIYRMKDCYHDYTKQTEQKGTRETIPFDAVSQIISVITSVAEEKGRGGTKKTA